MLHLPFDKGQPEQPVPGGLPLAQAVLVVLVVLVVWDVLVESA